MPSKHVRPRPQPTGVVAARLVWLLLVPVALIGLAACSSTDDPPDESAPVEEPAEAESPEPEPEAEPEPEPAAAEESEDTRPRSPLTGEPVDEALLDRPMLLTKIENSPQARPQSGLDKADVVYEELVEGGVTRFFAVFHSDLPEVAGPIRSARPIDTQLMGGYGPSGFAYSGAREEVRAMLGGVSAITITEGGAGFYRDSSRHAPHNLYLRPAETLEAVAGRGAEPVDDVRWDFDAELPGGALTCASQDAERCSDLGTAIDIRMSTSYRTGWEYDADDGVYRRFQNSEPFRVTGSGRIGAANVVVLATRHYVGASGYPETDVVTEDGAAVVLRDGERYAARWSKPSADAPVELTTTDGAAFPLKPGATWVHLPPASVVEALLSEAG